MAAYMLVLVFASRQCASSVVQEPTARLNSVRLRLSHTLSHQQTLTTLKRPEASPLKTANATDAPLRASSHSVPYYPLTPLGRSIKRVIVSAMLPGVCQGSDWRGEIGRWLARFLPQVPVVIWEARRWRFGSDSDAGESIRCRRCRNPEAAVRRSKEYECSSLQRIGKGDLVVVVGTGNVGCVYKPSLRDLPQCDMGRLEKRALPSIEALDRVWDTNRTVKVHFPVRALQALTREANVFGFDTIIEDDSFFKPMGGRGEASDTIKNCYRNAKKSDLLYVARYKEYKGQLKFLSQADPALLTGYTIHFYGGGANEDAVGERYFRAISRTARAKDIRIVMHKHVEKENLLKRICTASGQILWPMEDSNPRAGALCRRRDPSVAISRGGYFLAAACCCRKRNEGGNHSDDDEDDGDGEHSGGDDDDDAAAAGDDDEGDGVRCCCWQWGR